MRIPYHIALVEDDQELFVDFDNGREVTIAGRICDRLRILVRYFVTWVGELPVESVTFDLLFVAEREAPSSWHGQAVSLVYRNWHDWRYIDAGARPFAKAQAKHCEYPKPAIFTSEEFEELQVADDPVSDNDLTRTVIDSVDFIFKHDTRLARCFDVPL